MHGLVRNTVTPGQWAEPEFLGAANWLTGPRGWGSGSCQRVKWQRRSRRRPRSRGAAEGAGPGLRGERRGGDPAARPGTARLGTAMAARSAQVGRRRGPGLPGAFSGPRLRAAARGGRARSGLRAPSPQNPRWDPLALLARTLAVNLGPRPLPTLVPDASRPLRGPSPTPPTPPGVLLRGAAPSPEASSGP